MAGLQPAGWTKLPVAIEQSPKTEFLLNKYIQNFGFSISFKIATNSMEDPAVDNDAKGTCQAIGCECEEGSSKYQCIEPTYGRVDIRESYFIEFD